MLGSGVFYEQGTPPLLVELHPFENEYLTVDRDKLSRIIQEMKEGVRRKRRGRWRGGLEIARSSLRGEQS